MLEIFLHWMTVISLSFSYEMVIAPLLIIGYFLFDRNIFFHGVCIALVSMLIVAALKSFFQIPLSPSLGKEGYAFPSGHMFFAMSLYGFFYTFIRNMILKLSIIILLVLIGISLIYRGYHNIYDVAGAVFFSLIYIGGYKCLIKNITNKYLFVFILFAVTSFCLFFIKIRYEIALHLWMAYYSLYGFILSHYYFKQDKITVNKKRVKLLSLFLGLIFLYLINTIFTLEHSMFELIYPFKWFFLGIFIPFSSFLSIKICTKYFLSKNKQ